MKFYASKAHSDLNGRPFHPESISPNICLNPKYNTTILKRMQPNVLLDSGAFQDVRTQQRLSFNKALLRQTDFEDKVGFTSELIVSYDRLVDEKYDKEKGQIKQRVKYSTAEKYVKETIDAAKYLVDQRKDLGPRKLLLSNQGVTIEQYVHCIKEVLKFSDKQDVIGYGGFCIIGLKPRYEPHYYGVLKESLPLIKKRGIKRIHIFGVGKFRPLVRTQILCKEYGIEPSYDTSSCEFNSVMGSMFNPYSETLSQVFWKDEKYKKYHPAELAKFNIKMVNENWKSRIHMINKFWEELNKVELY